MLPGGLGVVGTRKRMRAGNGDDGDYFGADFLTLFFRLSHEAISEGPKD